MASYCCAAANRLLSVTQTPNRILLLDEKKDRLPFCESKGPINRVTFKIRFSHYSNDLNNGLVWYSNVQK